jgi:hypothetical protein
MVTNDSTGADYKRQTTALIDPLSISRVSANIWTLEAIHHPSSWLQQRIL